MNNKEEKNGCCHKDSGQDSNKCKTKCCPVTGIPLKCFGKVFLYAIVAALVIFGVDYVVWGKVFQDAVMQPDVVHLWRPMDAPEWKMLPVSDLVFGLCLAIAYVSLSPALTWCKGPSICRGFKFGIIISLIPAIAKTYTFYLVQPINSGIVYASFSSVFFGCVLGSGAIAALEGMCCRKKGECGTDKPEGSCSTEKNHCGSKE